MRFFSLATRREARARALQDGPDIAGPGAVAVARGWPHSMCHRTWTRNTCTAPLACPRIGGRSRPGLRDRRMRGLFLRGDDGAGGKHRCMFFSRARLQRRHTPALTSDLSLSLSFFPVCSRCLYDKRISAEIQGEDLGDEYKGYIFKVMGGNDKQGFGMKQGVLTAARVFLLMRQNTSGFQGHGRRKGERRRKACRGCIISPEIAVLNMMIVKQGDAPLVGLTDDEKPRMRGPKRAAKVRKLFNLGKDDDVRKYVNTYRREFESKTGKKKSKAPKIQRLVTANSLQRKRAERSVKKSRVANKQAEETEYRKLIAIRVKEAKERRSESLAKRRASSIAKKA
jgi:small subunit ribosomal protein S6e